jgi:hypothetical protein
MADNNKHTLTVAFVGATDMVLELGYTDVSDMEKARETLKGLDIPMGYSHHPAWALLGGISGKFSAGVSTAHVAVAGANIPDILVPWEKVQAQPVHQQQRQPA